MCSSNVSDPANRLRKTRKSNPTAASFSCLRSLPSAPKLSQQGKGRSSKRKENRRLSFLFAPAAGRGTLPPSADGESPAEVQRKTPRPERANPLTQFVCPGQPVQKRSRPLGANLPAAVRVPRSAGAEKTAAPSGRTRLRGSGAQSPGAAKKSAAHGHLSTCENQIFLRFTL